jgi:hypothetical protein
MWHARRGGVIGLVEGAGKEGYNGVDETDAV